MNPEVVEIRTINQNFSTGYLYSTIHVYYFQVFCIHWDEEEQPVLPAWEMWSY